MKSLLDTVEPKTPKKRNNALEELKLILQRERCNGTVMLSLEDLCELESFVYEYELDMAKKGWSSIETAPRDGTLLIITSGKGVYRCLGCGYWRGEIRYVEESMRPDEPEGFYWASDNRKSGLISRIINEKSDRTGVYWKPMEEFPESELRRMAEGEE